MFMISITWKKIVIIGLIILEFFHSLPIRLLGNSTLDSFYLFFASIGYFICNVLTLDIFNPYLNVLTDFITPFFLFIISQFYSPGKGFNYFELIGYIITIFGASILNELIILNFFGLNENIYSNISKRSEIESNQIIELSQVYSNDDLSDDGDIEKEGESPSNTS